MDGGIKVLGGERFEKKSRCKILDRKGPGNQRHRTNACGWVWQGVRKLALCGTLYDDDGVIGDGSMKYSL